MASLTNIQELRSRSLIDLSVLLAEIYDDCIRVKPWIAGVPRAASFGRLVQQSHGLIFWDRTAKIGGFHELP
jgi:hypothetical protein